MNKVKDEQLCLETLKNELSEIYLDNLYEHVFDIESFNYEISLLWETYCEKISDPTIFGQFIFEVAESYFDQVVLPFEFQKVA